GGRDVPAWLNWLPHDMPGENLPHTRNQWRAVSALERRLCLRGHGPPGQSGTGEAAGRGRDRASVRGAGVSELDAYRDGNACGAGYFRKRAAKGAVGFLNPKREINYKNGAGGNAF